MADIAGVICSALSCICGAPTCNLIDQYRNFNDDVADLSRRLTGLTGKKQDIVSKIQVEANGEQMVKQEVREWLKDVEEIDVEVQAFLQKVQRTKWYKRACLDKLVCTPAPEKMLERGSFLEGLMIERAPAPGLIFPTENLEGSTKDEVWKYLMDNEVRMIGVCGAGGVGKTAIMKHINNDLVRDGKFQKVIWVVVSYPLDVSELQKMIVDAMSKKKTVDAMGQTLPEGDKDSRAAALTQIMERERFVLILDDVWENFSLSEVGIPKPTGKNGCKVVITSRSDEVCNHLGCHKIVQVQPLSREKSRKLFLDRVGRDVLKDGGLEEILNSIVEECDGLPLVIVLIAGSLRGIYDIEEWRTMLLDLQGCVENAEGMEGKIFPRLKLSYDRLRKPQSQIQQCFLYCSLFREDYEFSRQELIEGWIDEGLIGKSDKRQEAYDRGHGFLNRLESNHLSEKTVNWHGADAFKMHDVVREMAIKSIGSRIGYMVRVGRKLTEVPNESDWVRDLQKVSLMANYISGIRVDLTPKCQTLSTLILSDNPLTEIPESFFEDMSRLKVLDLSRTNIEVLPCSMSKLEYLSALWLRGCQRLKCLPALEKLVALKKLDLKRAGIEVVPQGMEMLVSLEYLDLFCEDLKEIPTGILSKLSSLQYLVAKGNWGEFSVNIKINLEEVARLRKLEILGCNLDDMQDFNYLLREFKNFKSFIAYELVVGQQSYSMEIDIRKYKCKLIISECDIGEECIVLPDKLQHLRIHKCKNIRSSLNKIALLENATELGVCIISYCEEIEYVVELDSSSSSLCSPVLDKLEGLYLWDLPRLWALVRVEGVPTPPRVFSNLKALDIDGCSRMRQLLPLELLQAFQNLEEILVEDCN